MSDNLGNWKDILLDTSVFHAVKNLVTLRIFKQDLHLQIRLVSVS